MAKSGVYIQRKLPDCEHELCKTRKFYRTGCINKTGFFRQNPHTRTSNTDNSPQFDNVIPMLTLIKILLPPKPVT